uniref:3-oxoacyl-[acyl-carrier-protein] reductase n=1 Tax=Syphacia muris TaxID=451379 RepID=A0A0N5AVW6_9BILA
MSRCIKIQGYPGQLRLRCSFGRSANDLEVTMSLRSSNGIGRATAVLLAGEGSKLTITGRDTNALDETVTACINAGSKQEDIQTILGDIKKDEVRNQLIEETIKKFGKLDVLVNNHGGLLKEYNSDGEHDIASFDETMNWNVKRYDYFSSLAMCLKALPFLIKSKGCIVNVSSVASKLPTDANPCYSISKSALDQATRIIAYRYAPNGVRVNAVNPGFVRTPMLDKLGLSKDLQDEMEKVVERTLIPYGRFAKISEIAEVIAFLCDKKCSGYITGQTIVVDGGLTLAVGNMNHPDIVRLQEKLP